MVSVIEGRNGVLFLGGDDTNDIISQHTGKMDISPVMAAIYFTHFARSAYLKHAFGCQYVHIVSPNKETVGRDYMPADIGYQRFGLTPLRQYFQAFPDAANRTYFVPDVLEAFFEDRLYYMTDTHWTFRGAKRYFEAAFDYFGLADRRDRLRAMPLRVDDLAFTGDLATHSGRPGEVQQHMLPANPRARLVFFNGIENEGRLFHFLNPHCEDRVLIVMDSTASWILNFLAELFREVLAVHTSEMDWRFMSAYRPRFVFYVQCERFFPRTPRDGVNWSEMIAEQERIKSPRASALAHLSAAGYI